LKAYVEYIVSASKVNYSIQRRNLAAILLDLNKATSFWIKINKREEAATRISWYALFEKNK